MSSTRYKAAPFQVDPKLSTFLHRLPHKAGEILGQFHERISLANLKKTCDDHATASMRVVRQTNSMIQRPFFV